MSAPPAHDDPEPGAIQPGEESGQLDAGEGVRQFITPLKSIEQQVGEHVIAALQMPDTVGVLSAVVIGPAGGQHVVSTPLDPELLTEVQDLLAKASREKAGEVPCVGFHCHLKHRREDEGQKETGGS